MHLTAHNENKSIVAKRFIRRLKGNIYKIMTVSNSNHIWLSE